MCKKAYTRQFEVLNFNSDGICTVLLHVPNKDDRALLHLEPTTGASRDDQVRVYIHLRDEIRMQDNDQASTHFELLLQQTNELTNIRRRLSTPGILNPVPA